MGSKVFIEGNLGNDPDLRFTKNGRAIATLSIAVREGQGEGKEPMTVWCQVKVWAELGETVANRFRKGDSIACWCRVNEENWDDKNSGQKRTKLNFVSNEIYPGRVWPEKKGDRQSRPSPQSRPATAATPAANRDTEAPEDVHF